MNKNVLLTLLGAAALSVGKSGSNARSVFSSDKAKKRFEQLNGNLELADFKDGESSAPGFIM